MSEIKLGKIEGVIDKEVNIILEDGKEWIGKIRGEERRSLWRMILGKRKRLMIELIRRR